MRHYDYYERDYDIDVGALNVITAAMQSQLKDRGVMSQLVDRYGWEPPAIATAGGHLETLKLLLEAGCEADARNKYSGRSALHRCALIPWGGRVTEDARPCNKAFAAPVVMPRPPPHALS